MQKKLYEYVVLLHPKKNSKGEFDGDTQMIVHPEVILAADEKVAGLKVAREIPEQHIDSLDRVEIIIRPF